MKKIGNQLDSSYFGVIAHSQVVDSIICNGITTNKIFFKLFLASPAYEILHQIFLITFCQHMESLDANESFSFYGAKGTSSPVKYQVCLALKSMQDLINLFRPLVTAQSRN